MAFKWQFFICLPFATLFDESLQGLASERATENNEENPGYYEGDMIDVFDNTCNCIPQYEDYYFPHLLSPTVAPQDAEWSKTDDRYSSNAWNSNVPAAAPVVPAPKNLGVLWPNGVVVYQYVPDVDLEAIGQVERAMAYISMQTNGCVRFEPYDGSQKYVVSILLNPALDECASHVGMQPEYRQPQRLILGRSCTRKNGTILHELLHTLGMYHEHTRPDRDAHVQIFWASIQPEAKLYFNKYIVPNVTYPEVAFDVESVMLLNCYAFSVEPTWLTTMMPKKENPEKQIGQRKFLSEGDLIKLKKMYKCDRK